MLNRTNIKGYEELKAERNQFIEEVENELDELYDKLMK